MSSQSRPALPFTAMPWALETSPRRVAYGERLFGGVECCFLPQVMVDPLRPTELMFRVGRIEEPFPQRQAVSGV